MTSNYRIFNGKSLNVFEYVDAFSILLIALCFTFVFGFTQNVDSSFAVLSIFDIIFIGLRPFTIIFFCILLSALISQTFDHSPNFRLALKWNKSTWIGSTDIVFGSLCVSIMALFVVFLSVFDADSRHILFSVDSKLNGIIGRTSIYSFILIVISIILYMILGFIYLLTASTSSFSFRRKFYVSRYLSSGNVFDKHKRKKDQIGFFIFRNGVVIMMAIILSWLFTLYGYFSFYKTESSARIGSIILQDNTIIPAKIVYSGSIGIIYTECGSGRRGFVGWDLARVMYDTKFDPKCVPKQFQTRSEAENRSRGDISGVT